MPFIERERRDGIGAQVGLKDEPLFATSVQETWEWVKACAGIRCFTDGERRSGQQLWHRASVAVLHGEDHPAAGHRKVWREG